MAMDERSVEPAGIEAEINEIQSLGLDALRTRGRATFGRTPRPDLTKNVIGGMVAWRIQKQAFGGLDRETLKLLEDLIRGKNDGLEGKRVNESFPRPPQPFDKRYRVAR